MNKEPIIHTDRLILRPITLDAADACFSWNSDESEWNGAFVLKKENKVIGTGGFCKSADR